MYFYNKFAQFSRESDLLFLFSRDLNLSFLVISLKQSLFPHDVRIISCVTHPLSQPWSCRPGYKFCCAWPNVTAASVICSDAPLKFKLSWQMTDDTILWMGIESFLSWWSLFIFEMCQNATEKLNFRQFSLNIIYQEYLKIRLLITYSPIIKITDINLVFLKWQVKYVVIPRKQLKLM